MFLFEASIVGKIYRTVLTFGFSSGFGLKEEQAEQAVDELRLLKEEINHYIQHSRPISTLKPEQIQRLIELVKKPAVSTRR